MAFSTSRALSILPSCFRCVARVSSPEKESSKRLEASSPRPVPGIPGHDDTVGAVAAAADGNVESHADDGNVESHADEGKVEPHGELLPSEAEKTESIDEQKRSDVAEAMERTGGEDSLCNDGGDTAGSRKVTRFELDELLVYELKKRRWLAEQERPMEYMLRGWSKPRPRMSNGDSATPPGYPQRRVRYGPESDAAFLKAVIAAGKSGGERDRGADEWSKMELIRLRRQRYLRDYCPFQREEESVPEETPDDAAEVERTEPVQPANDPDTELVSIIEKNQQERGGDGGVSNEVPFPGAGEDSIRDDDTQVSQSDGPRLSRSLGGRERLSSQCDGRRLSRMLGGRNRLPSLDGEVSQCDGRRLSRMLGGRDRLSSARLLD